MYTNTLVYRYTGTPIPRDTNTRVHQNVWYTNALVHKYTGIPIHLYTGTEAHRYTSIPVHKYTHSLVHRYTGTMVEAIVVVAVAVVVVVVLVLLLLLRVSFFTLTHMSVLEGGITGDTSHAFCAVEAGVFQGPY